MTRSETEELENQILHHLKKKHVKEIALDQYMKEQNIDQDPKEKYKLIGALKDFKKIKRDYVSQGKKCWMMLQIV